jgi:2,4-diketo-3-deoxy-L-fuconate hydrolase
MRDVQRRHGNQWFKGKSMDTHCPLGPLLVTADELGDPQTLDIMCRVNGIENQRSNTSLMIFDVAAIIHELSRGMELLPGDVIMTGTPSGIGAARTPPEFLAAGDVVEVDISRIGVLRNTVVMRKWLMPEHK